MMDEKHTHRVTHKSLYLTGKDGVLQLVPYGTLVGPEIGKKLQDQGMAEDLKAVVTNEADEKVKAAEAKAAKAIADADAKVKEAEERAAAIIAEAEAKAAGKVPAPPATK